MEMRERRILEAATQVFLRYGVKRASMGDIATEAGVARQTLYNFYSNKDDILRRSIRMFGKDAFAAIEAELPHATTLAEKLDLVMREMVLKPFQFLHSSPNAQDLIEGYNAAGREEMEANYLTFQNKLEKLLAPYTEQLEARSLSPALLAEIARRSAASIKHQAKDEAHLLALISGLRSMVLSAVQES